MLVVALLAGFLLWADFYSRVIGPGLTFGEYPTSTYWVAPRLVLEGRGAQLYDVEAFGDAAQELGARRDRGFIPNAPIAVLPLLPFGLLAQVDAYAAWTLFGLAALVTAVAILLRSLRAPPLAAVSAFALVPIFQPLRENFGLGQAFAFVLLALALAARATTRIGHGQAMGGMALSMATILKAYYGVIALFGSFVVGRGREIAVAAAVVGVAIAASLPIVGWGGWLVWIETSLAWRARPETTVTAYQTLHSLFGHLFRFDADWNPAPLANVPLVADLLWYLAVGALLTISAAVVRRARSSAGAPSPARRMMPVALFVPLAIVASPIAEDYHYLLTLLPIAVLIVALLVERPAWPLWLALVAALALLGPAWPFNRQPVDGVVVLFFYPRLYGALLLWLALLTLLIHPPARDDCA